MVARQSAGHWAAPCQGTRVCLWLPAICPLAPQGRTVSPPQTAGVPLSTGHRGTACPMLWTTAGNPSFPSASFPPFIQQLSIAYLDHACSLRGTGDPAVSKRDQEPCPSPADILEPALPQEQTSLEKGSFTFSVPNSLDRSLPNN